MIIFWRINRPVELAFDRTPVIRATLDMGFPYNFGRGWSLYETQTLFRRKDYFDPEGA